MRALPAEIGSGRGGQTPFGSEAGSEGSERSGRREAAVSAGTPTVIFP